MLSIVHTAETQFRHESAERARERMLIAAIREREAALAAERATPTTTVRVPAWPLPAMAQRNERDCVAPA